VLTGIAPQGRRLIGLIGPGKDPEAQKQEIAKFADTHGATLAGYMLFTLSPSGAQDSLRAAIDSSGLAPGDCVVVTELAMLGPDDPAIATSLRTLTLEKRMGIASILEGIDMGFLAGSVGDSELLMLVKIASLYSSSKRSKKARGGKLLAIKHDDLVRHLDKGVSKAALARLFGVSRVTIINYIKSSGLGKYMKKKPRQFEGEKESKKRANRRISDGNGKKRDGNKRGSKG